MKNSRKKGFTLLELSIVILIIGLIFGGIFAGEEIIRAGKIRATLSEFDQITMAFKLFKDKYGAPAGDFTRASEVFGCTAGTAPVGCNGNGDGGAVFGDTVLVGEGSEDLRAWQHLSLSGLLPGGYTGVVTVASQRDIGINVPKAEAKPGGYYNNWSLNTEIWPNNIHTFVLGGFRANAGNFEPTRSPIDTREMDQKIDDGRPLRGSVFVASDTGCFTGTGATATYVASKEVTCRPRIVWLKDR